MRHDEGGRRNAAWIARLTFSCGAILIISRAGQAHQAESDRIPKIETIESRVSLKKVAEDDKKTVMLPEKSEEDFIAAEDLKKSVVAIKKAEDELKRAEDLYEKKAIGNIQVEEARRKLLELKVSEFELQLLLGEIGLAKSYITRAEERLNLARNTEKQGERIKNWQTNEELTLQMATFRLERAKSQLTVYLRYTRPKMEGVEQALDEGEAAQRLDQASAKITPAQTGQEISTPTEAKSDRQKLAEYLLGQRVHAIRTELSPKRLNIKQHEHEVEFTAKLHKAGFVPESEIDKEKLALQKVRDFLTAMHGKLKELQPFSAKGDGATASKIEAKAVDIPGEDVARITLKGVAREKGTGHPIEGAFLTLGPRVTPFASHTITDKEGRYEFADVPEAEENSLVGEPFKDESFFITSARANPAKTGENTVNLDLDFVRGIPYRVRVLDKATGRPFLDPATGKPFQGGFSYFPVTPNDPYKREVWGDSKAQETGAITGAFSESGNVDARGEYSGAVLPGPGVLCFTTDGTKNLKSADHKPSLFFPDGKDVVRILSREKSPVSAILVPIRGSSSSLAIGLKRYAAVIAINPREDVKEVSYEIKLNQAEATK